MLANSYAVVSSKRVGGHREVILRVAGNHKDAIQEVFNHADSKPMPVTLFWVNSQGNLIKSRAGANGVFVGSARHTMCGPAHMRHNTVKVVLY